MALEIICPHCKKKVIESYRIINPYLYGSKIQICKKCGGKIFDNRWREVAIQGFDPIQDTEKKYTSWFGSGLGVIALLLMNRDFGNIPLGSPALVKVGLWVALIIGGVLLLFYFRHLFGFVKRKNQKYMEESVARLQDPAYVAKLLAHGVRVSEEYNNI